MSQSRFLGKFITGFVDLFRKIMYISVARWYQKRCEDEIPIGGSYMTMSFKNWKERRILIMTVVLIILL